MARRGSRGSRALAASWTTWAAPSGRARWVAPSSPTASTSGTAPRPLQPSSSASRASSSPRLSSSPGPTPAHPRPRPTARRVDGAMVASDCSIPAPAPPARLRLGLLARLRLLHLADSPGSWRAPASSGTAQTWSSWSWSRREHGRARRRDEQRHDRDGEGASNDATGRRARTRQLCGELRRGTLQLARENLEREQRISELRNQCTIIRSTELAATEERLADLERQKDEIMKSSTPAALLDKLQSSMAKLDEESEELDQKFLEKDMDLPSLVQKYKKLRAAYHKCDKLHQSGEALLGC